jgi:hypothetical protein
MSLCLYRHKASPNLGKKETNVSLYQIQSSPSPIEQRTIEKTWINQNVITYFLGEQEKGDSYRMTEPLMSNYKVLTYSEIAGQKRPETWEVCKAAIEFLTVE